MSFDEYWELMQKSVWFNSAMVECRNNQSILINLRELSRIIIITEYPNQKFIIWKEDRNTIVKKIIVTIDNPGRHELCLCMFKFKTIWKAISGDLYALNGGGVMSSLPGSPIGNKIVIKYNKKVPSLKYLCHKSISAGQEETFRNYSKGFRRSLLMENNDNEALVGREELPPCKCNKRKSLTGKFKKAFKISFKRK
jgi:hypothetical protein